MKEELYMAHILNHLPLNIHPFPGVYRFVSYCIESVLYP